MKYKTLSIRIPEYLCDLLQAEAFNQTRNRSKQIAYILKERYNAHAPPNNHTHTITSQTRANGVSRKQKTKATA